MLTDASMNQTVRKLDRLCDTLYRRIFTPVGQAEFLAFTETKKPLNRAPEDAPWSGRLPERWGPGRFDYWGNSHQIMHLLSVGSILQLHAGVVPDLLWAARHTCLPD